MKTIGLIGGLSPESTITYYKGLNDGVRARLGGNHGARILLSSVDFQVFCDLKDKGDWDTQAQLLILGAQRLEEAGADYIVLATNTMHKMAEEISASIHIPFIHIADATAEVMKANGITKTGLLGTRYVMEEDFYARRIKSHGIDVVVPDATAREEISRIIYEELCKGEVRGQSRKIYQEAVARMVEEGAEGVILGCTEIGMLIGEDDVSVQVFDTAQIHVEAALKKLLGDI